MICLFIDTSISFPTISIIKDNEILFKYHEQIKNDMSSKILPILDDALINLNLSLKLIDKIFVVNGPGSFTGVRIGVTIAKTIAWALNKPIIPISSLEYMATTNTDKKYLLTMIDARRNNVFAGIYNKELEPVKPDCLININELLNNINEDYILLSYDNLPNCMIPVPNVIKVIEKYKNSTGVSPHNLNPNYLKLTEAEEKRINND